DSLAFVAIADSPYRTRLIPLADGTRSSRTVDRLVNLCRVRAATGPPRAASVTREHPETRPMKTTVLLPGPRCHAALATVEADLRARFPRGRRYFAWDAWRGDGRNRSHRRDPMGVSLQDLLSAAVAREASDLHLSAGTTPQIRIHGIIQPLDGFETLAASEIERLINTVLTEAQRRGVDGCRAPRP